MGTSSMNVTFNDLRKVKALHDLPEAHLQWIINHSEYREYNDGEPLIKTGDPIIYMWITLEGAVRFYMDINGKQVYYYNFENDEASGGVGGVLPYSRMIKSPGYAYAHGKVKVLLMHKKHFPELEKLNSSLIMRLISYMTNRARAFATMQLQQEKVTALGQLSAGIAHELNNPAAAINRMSHELTGKLIQNFELTQKLIKKNPDFEHINYLRKLVELKFPIGTYTNKLKASKRILIEDEIQDWLNDHNIQNHPEICETFADASITGEELDIILDKFGSENLEEVLLWLENLVSSQQIISDLEKASSRISQLVGAIKSHVHMDRTNGPQETNICDDIENTLTLLGYKLREKNIEIIRDYSEKLPHLQVYVGELNQVWMNLIDNAIFAMEKGGKLTIRVYAKSKDVYVHIIDNGSGIPPEVVPRIFDPFFTTKKVGAGTGIGLDLVSRIVKKHGGQVKVNSVPGNTEFIVCIPVNQNKAAEQE